MELDVMDRRDEMVERQIAARGIRDPHVLAAFREVPREAFVPDNLAEFAYDDSPLPIAEGQTISQPYIVAAMIEGAGIAPGDKVLEVGAGSGYAAAVIGRIAGEVFAIERHKPLADAAELRLARLGYRNVTVIAADGSGGLPDEAPFDAILVAARGPEVPEALKRQLKLGGRLVIPVGSEAVQSLCRITRTGEDTWDSDDLGAVRFVPLIGVHGLAEDGTRAASDHRGGPQKTLAQLVKQAAEPLPDIADPAFAAAFDRFAGKRVVMLGEASHGTHEFYAARAAITRRFVERHGFNIVAVEADWPDAAAIDRYIGHGEPRPGAPKPFRRFPTWMWRNTVIEGLIHDLRALNQGRAAADRIGFYGLDIYNMAGSIEAVLAHLDKHDPQAAQIARERYGCLTPWQSDPAIYGRVALSRGYAECEEAVVAQCRDLLEQALDGDPGLLDAAMNARLVASTEKYYRVMYYGGAESWNLRDAHMAETLEHLLEARGPQAKALVWAHNSHIGDARATDMGAARGEHNIGQLIRQKLRDEVALIGFGTHTGSVAAASDWDGEMELKRVLPSRRDSYEWVMHEAGGAGPGPRFLLDLAAGDPALRRRLSEPRLERFIGVIYRPETERWSHYSEAVLPDQFDAYVWFGETRALTALDAHQPHTGVPETYPFGL